jgi:hypothetical protein
LDALLFVVLLGLVVVSVAGAWRADTAARHLRTELDELRVHMGEVCTRCDLLEESFMKVLAPIRQNTEDLAQLDDDIIRIDKRIDELKSRGEPPAAA